MKNKYKKKLVKVFSVFVSLLMVFALVPVTANAADNTIYSDDDISIVIEEKLGASGSKNVDFTVIVDGEIKVIKTMTDVPITLGYVKVAAEGYDVTFDTSGMSVSEADGLIGFDLTTDSHSCTINLTTEKTKDDIDIQNGDTVYGKFLWSKQHADTSAYARDIEIYVNGEYAYTQTVNTPKELSNLIGVNKEFWFEPNLDLYNANYEMNRDYVNQVEKDLKIYLTTKCGCGLDTCLCEGGCDCTVNCPCEACQGTNLADNQINTGYGIITYKEPGSSGGYRLQVRINLNGQIVYTSDWLRVYGGLPGNLKFDLAQGYYYQKPNDYDINTLRSGSTWIEGTGQLSIVGITQEVRNYDNVLTINLVNFDNSVSLDVERRQGSPMNNVNGYRVSYEVNGVSYTYDYYNFGAAQTPNIPTNTPVTITAICNSPYEVNQWSTGNAHAGNVTLEGSEGESGTEAYGNSVTLTVNSANDPRILLYIDSLKTVEVPTDDDLINTETGLLKDNAVMIDCINDSVSHESETYGLEAGTYTIGDLAGNSADGYTCDITITNPDTYVKKYNETLDNHTLDPENQDNQTITLRYVNGEWTVGEEEAPVTYTVSCPTIPQKPDKPTVEGLLVDSAVTINCINKDASHADKAKTYSLLDGYTIGDVEGNETDGYTVDVTVAPNAYVTQYNTDTGVDHDLSPDTQGEKTIQLVYVNDKWTVKEGSAPVSYDVVCVTDPGTTTPDKPTDDQVEVLLKDNAVTIDCTNKDVDHADKTYGLLGEYIIGEVQGNETDGYTVDVTVAPDAYVTQYNTDTVVDHVLSPNTQGDKVITLVYAEGQWKVEDGSAPVTYTVVCDTDSGEPTDPTDPTTPTDPSNPGDNDGNQGDNGNTDGGNGNNTGNTDNDGNINGSGNTGNNGNNGGQNVNTGNNANNGNGTGTNGTGTTSSTNSSQNPKTSDDSAIVTWMSLVVLAAGGIAVITKKTLKKNK